MIDKDTGVVSNITDAKVTLLHNSVIEISNDVCYCFCEAHTNPSSLLDEKVIVALVDIVHRIEPILGQRKEYYTYCYNHGIYGDSLSPIAYVHAIDLVIRTLLALIHNYHAKPDDELFMHIRGNASRILGLTLIFNSKPGLSYQHACFWHLTNITEH